MDTLNLLRRTAVTLDDGASLWTIDGDDKDV